MEKNLNQAKITATQKDINRLDAQIQDQASVYELSVFKELTPEQQEKVRYRMGERRFGSLHEGDHRFLPPPPHEGFGYGHHPYLTKEQFDSMKESQCRFTEEKKDLRNNLAVKYMDMRNLFQDPKTDAAKLLAKQKDINAFQQQFAEKKVEMMIRNGKT